MSLTAEQLMGWREPDSDEVKDLRSRISELEADLERGNAEHEKFVADVLHIRGRVEWLEEENERLRKALEEIVRGAPTEEPERYEGDNHGDSYYSGWDRGSYHAAQTARAALAQKETK